MKPGCENPAFYWGIVILPRVNGIPTSPRYRTMIIAQRFIAETAPIIQPSPQHITQPSSGTARAPSPAKRAVRRVDPESPLIVRASRSFAGEGARAPIGGGAPGFHCMKPDPHSLDCTLSQQTAGGGARLPCCSTSFSKDSTRIPGGGSTRHIDCSMLKR